MAEEMAENAERGASSAMKVYVVTAHTGHGEDNDVVGIYSSAEKAKAAVNRRDPSITWNGLNPVYEEEPFGTPIAECRRFYPSVYEWFIDDDLCDTCWRYHGDGVCQGPSPYYAAPPSVG